MDNCSHCDSIYQSKVGKEPPIPNDSKLIRRDVWAFLNVQRWGPWQAGQGQVLVAPAGVRRNREVGWERRDGGNEKQGKGGEGRELLVIQPLS